MYASFFGLAQAPFSIAPDPHFLFMSERHREALAHLVYGVQGGGGFVLLSGEIGAGKTTVVRCFLEQIPADCNVAYIFNPKLTARELVQSVCDEFGVEVRPRYGVVPSIKDSVDALNRFLLGAHAAGRSNVLVIDEAQMLAADVLEQLRLLTNLETDQRKLLQIVLVGQPELRSMLAGPGLEQLAQRVIARFHLGALSRSETAHYVAHRLAVAGLARPSPFDAAALRRIHRISRGVPRRINLLCDRALLGAYSSDSPRVTVHIVEQAAREVFDPLRAAAAPRSPARIAAWTTALVLGGIGVAVAVGVAVGLAVRGGGGEAGRALAAPAASGIATAARPASVAAHSATAASLPASGASALVASAMDTAFDDEAAAWRELAGAWRVELPAGDPCSAAATTQQLQCFRSAAGLAQIRKLDRPVILALQDGRGRTSHALLTGLTDRTATLRGAGARSQSVPLAVLARQWRGDFATFWRAPAGFSGGLVDSRLHPSSAWLEERLVALQGGGRAAEERFDARLRERVQAFQIAQGLKADGLAGPTTLMQLNRASGIDEPRLEPATRAH